MPAIFFVFFLSGLVSLAYEVVWMRQLALIFGATTYAIAAILSVFMGGLAIGSQLFGRLSDRAPRPLLVYALLELGVGLYALLVPVLFEWLRTPYVALYAMDLPHGVLAAARGLLAAIVLLPPTILMGGTLPLLARLVIRLRGNVGRQVALLYFANTAGAVSGCTLAGFYLIEHLGVIGTIRVGAMTNFALVAIALALHFRLPSRPAESGSAAPASADQRARVSPAAARLVLLCIGLSGFTSLAYESFWARALLRYLYNSTYAFTTMLAVFLAGIALGSWLYLALPLRRTRPLALFALLEIGVGIGFIISAQLFVSLDDVSAMLLGQQLTSFSDTLRALVIQTTLVLFVPALLLGATVPLATDICTRHLDRAGSTVGRVYAVNTVGAILGTLAITFVMIPNLGMQGSLHWLLALNLSIAAALLWADMPRLGQRSLAVAIILVVAVSILTMPGDIFRDTFSTAELVFYDEGATDTVGVVEDANGHRSIVYQDRRGTAGTMSYPLNYLLGHLPVLLHPGEPKSALHICFGVGNSLSALARNESIESIDSVELSPHVLDAAPYFWTNDGVAENPKIRTIIDDGRNFVMATDRRYDVIQLEPPEAFTNGVINLYTREFYADVYDRLNPDGVFLQWLHMGQAPIEDEKMYFRAFQDIFEHTSLWQQLNGGSMLIIGTKRPLEIDYARLIRRLEEPLMRRDMAVSDIHDADDLLRLFVLGPESLKALLKDVAPITDDRTVLDFSMPRYHGSGFGMGIFAPRALQKGQAPQHTMAKHIAHYQRRRTSVLPYLTNYAPLERDVLDSRIQDRELPDVGNFWVDAMSKAEWTLWATQGRED